jgi:hypothetical protein
MDRFPGDQRLLAHVSGRLQRSRSTRSAVYIAPGNSPEAMDRTNPSNQMKTKDMDNNKEVKRLPEAMEVIRELVAELEKSKPPVARAFDHFHERAKRFLQSERPR